MAKKQSAAGGSVKKSGDGAGSNGVHDARTMHASRGDVELPAAPTGPPPGAPPPSAPPPDTAPPAAQTKDGKSGQDTKAGKDGKDGKDGKAGFDANTLKGATVKKASSKLTSTGPKKPPLPSSKQQQPADSKKLGVDVAVLWRGDMLTAGFFPNPTTISAGPDGSFVVPEEAMGSKKLILVEPHSTAAFGLRIDTDKATGHVIVDGNVHDVGEVRDGKVDGLRGPVVALTGGTRAVLVFGDFTFIISRVPVPPPAKFALWDRRILPFAISWSVAFLMTTVPLVMAFNSPEWRNRAKMNFAQQQEQRIAELEFIEVQEEEKPEEKEEEKEEEKKEETPIQKEEIKKEEEKVDEKQVQKEVNEIEKALENLNEDEKEKKVKEMVDQAVKQTAALDEALAAIDNPVGTKLFAESDDGSAENAENPEAGAGGTEVLADPNGDMAKDMAASVGGKKEDRLGGKDATSRARVAALEKVQQKQKDVNIGLKARAQKVVRVGGAGGSKASGELPKKVIKRYIARKMGAIKACYQKGLQSNPGLQGKVRVKFLIMPTGAVAGAKIEDSGLNSPAVENCIVRNIKTWKFPRAKGGGSTKVIYPFVFSRR